MDKYCCCHHGNTLPALRSHDQSHDLREKEQEKEEEESDAEVIQRDVVEVMTAIELCSEPLLNQICSCMQLRTLAARLNLGGGVG